ncbi:DUF1624 domain-containing protein [Candidatus Peregrinibacteria bacterium]|nr:MAG: DUF1624 domain-containing protein [Candidatus Peregrinibacteria bacterium]
MRIRFLDEWRGLAIVGMVFYHLAFDLDYSGILLFDFSSLFWLIWARLVQFSFLLLVGLSLFLSFKNSSSNHEFLRKQARRAAFIFAMGMLITLITYFAFPDAYIRFGVLHLVAVSIVIGSLLIRNIPATLTLACSSVILGQLFEKVTTNTSWLIPIGVFPQNTYSFDWFPLFPWLSLPLSGILLGRLLDHFQLWNAFNVPIPPLEFIGRHALLIYLVHQPLLLGFIWLL